MASPSIAARTPSSLRPLAIYWAIGVVVGSFALRSDIAQIVTKFGTGHVLSVGIGLLVTLVTMVAYDQISMSGGRSLHLPTFIGFPLLNGICETILFIASFKIGVALANSFTTQPLWLFLAGTVTFFAYSGAIHALFWLKILPPHLDKSPKLKSIRRVWILGLVAVSLMWGWIYFTYQDFWSVAVLHAIFDAGMVYSIRYRLA